MGTAENAGVRSYLVDELAVLGLRPELQTITVPDYFGAPGATVEVVNVMARIPGTVGAKAVAVMAHYDSVPTTPGANDDAAGVAAVLEVGRVIVGGFVREAPDPVVFSFLTQTAELIGRIGTDFDSFAAVGIPGVHFAYVRGSPIYHTPNDAPINVDADSVGHHGSNALGVVRFFGNTDLADPPQSGDDVFFTVVGSHVVRYPAGWSLPLAAVAIAVSSVAIALGARRGNTRIIGIVGSTAAILGGMAVSVLVASLIWWLITGVRTSPGMAESYAYLAAMVLLAAAAWMMTSRIVRMRWSATEISAGAVILWLVLAVVTSTTLVGMSYLFVWSTLGASTVLLIRASVPDGHRWLGTVGVALVATPTLVVMAPPIDFFFQMALPRPGNPGSQVVGVIVVVILLAYLSIALIGSSMAGCVAPGTGRPNASHDATYGNAAGKT